MAQELSDIDLIIDFLQSDTKAGIISSQQQKGLKASGKSASQLRVAKEGEKIAQLIDGSGSFEFQNYGRRPGKMPPMQEIYLWLAFRKYGLDWKTEEERESLTRAISRKIAIRGTFTFMKQRPTGVLTDNITAQKLSILTGLLADKKATEVLTDITRIFKQK